MKKCPFCAEDIQDQAVVCKHCGRELGAQPQVATVPQRQPGQEKTYFNSGNTTITSTRAIIASKTYTMSHITSVQAVEIKKNQLPPLIFLIGGILLLLIGFSGESLGFCIGSGGLLALIGIVMMVLNRDKYTVRIGSSSGEADALVSTDQGRIRNIVAALQQAIVERG